MLGKKGAGIRGLLAVTGYAPGGCGGQLVDNPQRMLSVLLLVAGLTLLLAGGAALVRGASGLARGLGISPSVIGLTVVAFGTSAPELTVNLSAAASGTGDVAFGNVAGSNLANLGLVLGLTALVRPLRIKGEILAREMPFMALAGVVAVVLAADGRLRGQPGAIDRSDGLCLLLFFSIFLYATVLDVVRGHRDPLLTEAQDFSRGGDGRHLVVDSLLTMAGLAGLYFGGRLTVEGATDLALSLGVSDAVVSLTVVAVGTSLPEMVTSGVAAVRGETDIAVGNVVGSNIFNTFFVFGVTGAIAPLAVPPGGLVDLAAGAALALVLLPAAVTDERRLMRWEGAGLLAAWVLYTAWRWLA